MGHPRLSRLSRRGWFGVVPVGVLAGLAAPEPDRPFASGAARRGFLAGEGGSVGESPAADVHSRGWLPDWGVRGWVSAQVAGGQVGRCPPERHSVVHGVAPSSFHSSVSSSWSGFIRWARSRNWAFRPSTIGAMTTRNCETISAMAAATSETSSTNRSLTT